MRKVCLQACEQLPSQSRTPHPVHARVRAAGSSSTSGRCRTRGALNPGRTAALRPQRPAPTAGQAPSLHFSKLPLAATFATFLTLTSIKRHAPCIHCPPGPLPTAPLQSAPHLVRNRERSLALDQAASTGGHAGDRLGSAGLVRRHVPVGFLFV